MVQLKREKVKSEEQLNHEKSTISLSEVYVLISQILFMEFIEMIAWICVGFVPTLGLGNLIWSRVDKRKDRPIPWSV